MKYFVCLGIALLLGACAIKGNVPAPAPGILPQAFSGPGANQDLTGPAPEWWAAFGSQELSSFVATAFAANPDLAIYAERVHQAEAQVHVAGASLFPELNLNAGSSQRTTRRDDGNWHSGASSRAALNTSYEIDLWGKNTSAVRAAEASLLASRFDREAIRLSLIAGVANAYFQVLSLRSRLMIARKNLKVALRVLAIVDSRVRNGVASRLDHARQQAAVLTQKAAIPPLELQERQNLFALAILLGRAPEDFEATATTVDSLAVPRVAPGLPSQLLSRRPDLASAEAQLAAVNAAVTGARVAMLPGIALTGSAGVASNMLVNLLNSPATTLTLGVSVMQPVFDGGRLDALLDAASARERELVENYRKAIFTALADVENALIAGERTAEQEQLQQEVVEQMRLALRLAEIRYREGADDLMTTLDVQRTLFQAEDQLAQIRLSRLQASVSLFKALGGAWELPPKT